jgi:hypothetical protein
MLKGIDRFLATILVVIFLVVVLAVVLVWRSPTATELEYSAGTGPGDTVHNYVVAISRGDEDRAKSYLSPEILEDIERREEDHGFELISSYRSRSDTGVRVGVDEESVVDGLATVHVTLTWYHTGPNPMGLLGIFGSNRFSSDFEIRLRQFEGEWKIVKPFDLYMLN